LPELSGTFCQKYLKTFAVRYADSPALRREAQQLRYQVYCVEKGFEPANAMGLEQDRFDERAPHALLYHRQSSIVVGTVRVVLPDANRPGESLPIHGVCSRQVLAEAALPPGHTAEISRLSVSKRRMERALGHPERPGVSADMRQILAFSCVGLIAAARQIALCHGITHVAAIMRPALLRRLRAMGVAFVELDERIAYRGLRIACYARLANLEAGIRDLRPDLWSLADARTG
jgi:N-acyl amino acid synthase of PEP-CTERM/exosortase system